MRRDAILARRILPLALEPARTVDIARDLGLPYRRVRSCVKSLAEYGRLERVGRGVYRTTAVGRALLEPARAPQPLPPRLPPGKLRGPRPPAGRGCRGDRLRWLLEHFERLGSAECARRLGVCRNTVLNHAQAHGLRHGDAPDRVTLVDLARLTGHKYTNLREQARAAGVLERVGGGRASVPLEWADAFTARLEPKPDPTDVPLVSLVAAGIPYATLERWTRGRRLVVREPGRGGVRAFVPAEVARELLHRRAA